MFRMGEICATPTKLSVALFSNSATCTSPRIVPAELITRPSCPSPKKSPSETLCFSPSWNSP